jgi:hypothetical protein
MTERDRKMIRNRSPGFLIFNGQAVRQMARHVAIRESSAVLVPVMLERVFSEST